MVEETTCSNGQSRTEQTQVIERNLHYDFNFQQTNNLPEEIIVKPVRFADNGIISNVIVIITRIGIQTPPKLLLRQHKSL